jgi:hypothetical protein
MQKEECRMMESLRDNFKSVREADTAILHSYFILGKTSYKKSIGKKEKVGIILLR